MSGDRGGTQIISFIVGTTAYKYDATGNPSVFRCSRNAGRPDSKPTNCLYLYRDSVGHWIAAEYPLDANPTPDVLETSPDSVWRFGCAHTGIRQGWHRWQEYDVVGSSWHSPKWFYTAVQERQPAAHGQIADNIVVEGLVSDSDLDSAEHGPGGSGGMRGGPCFTCGSANHYAINCPRRPPTGGGGRAGSSSGFAGPARPFRPPPW